MKHKTPHFLVLGLFTLLLAGCDNKKETKESKQDKSTTKDNTVKTDLASNSIALEAPDFADPELKQYYSSYTAYIKKLVASIRRKDEAGTMTLFREEGKQFNNQNEMDKKAKNADERKFTAWLMKAVTYQQEIVQSEYYKKFNEEYYKKVKEDFEKKNN